MAVGTITKVGSPFPLGGHTKGQIATVQLTSGANYTTGGETIALSKVGFGHKIDGVIPFGNATASDGATARTVQFLYQTNGTVKMVVSTTASAQAASNSDQSAHTVRCLFIGR